MFASHMTENDARFYTMSPLAHGAKGLCFYAWQPMSSGYESAGFGMANLDGSPSDRALAAGALAAVSQDMPAFYRAKSTRAQAAVCLNNYANIMWLCMRQPWHYIPSRCYLGAYRALYQQHLPVDFIHPDYFASDRLLAPASPFAFMLSRQPCHPSIREERRHRFADTHRLNDEQGKLRRVWGWKKYSAAGRRAHKGWTKACPCRSASPAHIRLYRCYRQAIPLLGRASRRRWNP
jgi:hypothetical protein